MSEGMEVFHDRFTDADRDMLRELHHSEIARTEEVASEVKDGVIVRGYERREVYTFNAPEIGMWRFDVRLIKNAILDGYIPAVMFRMEGIPAHFYEHVLNNNGVEPDRLDKINDRDLDKPGIMVMWPDGNSSMIDGNHRLCRRYQLKMGTFRFLMIDVGDCAPFMCRPGDEKRLFELNKDDAITLHSEVRVEGLSEWDNERIKKLGE